MSKKPKQNARPKRKNHRKSVVLFVTLAVVLVAPTVVLARASASTDERVARWFLSGVDIHKVAAETKKEQQYGLAALGLGAASLLALFTAIIFEAKHIKQVRGVQQEVEPAPISSDRDA